MPRYELVSPEGGKFEVNAPEGATDQQVMEYFQSNYQPQEKPGFIERTGERLGERISDVGEMAERNFAGGYVSDALKAPKVAALTAGQAVGGAFDIVGEGIKTAYDVGMPEAGKEYISEKVDNALQNPLVQKGLNALQAGGKVYSEFKSNYPDAAMALGGLTNMAMLKGTGMAAVEGKAIKKDVNNLITKKLPKAIDKDIYNTVKTGIEKSARPGVEGKRTFGQTKAFFKKADNAVRAIVENKGSLRLTDDLGEVVEGLPKTLQQFSQAIHQSKANIYKQYDELAKQAGNVKIDAGPIARQVKIFGNNKAINDFSPGVASYAAQQAERMLARGSYSPKEVQEAISILNSRLKAYYANPSYDGAATATVDAMIANSLRKKLDNAIMSATGTEYQTLKNQYGSLMAIERDVNRRAIVDSRKNTKGLIDFTDIYSGSQAIHAMSTNNPAMFASAATAKGISKYYKWLNDPNTVVEKMFRNVDELASTKKAVTGEFEPVSATGKAIKGKVDELNTAKAKSKEKASFTVNDLANKYKNKNALSRRK